jgi:hypothetical protein
MDKGVISKYTNIFKTKHRLLVLDILKTEKKATFAIVLFPIQNILDEGHYLSRK